MAFPFVNRYFNINSHKFGRVFNKSICAVGVSLDPGCDKCFVLGGSAFKFLGLSFIPSFLLLLPVKAAYGRRCCECFLQVVNATTFLKHPLMPHLWPWYIGVTGAPCRGSPCGTLVLPITSSSWPGALVVPSVTLLGF